MSCTFLFVLAAASSLGFSKAVNADVADADVDVDGADGDDVLMSTIIRGAGAEITAGMLQSPVVVPATEIPDKR